MAELYYVTIVGMSNSPYNYTLAQYVEHVNSPRAFFTVHGEFTPESLFMAYLNHASLYHPASSSTLFRDLLVQCLVAHAYYLENKARFYKQQDGGWESKYVPSVRGLAAQINADVHLKKTIDTLVSEWLPLCDQALYQQLYSARNGQLFSPKNTSRALSFLFALSTAVLVVFSVANIHTALAPAYLAPASLFALLLCLTLYHAMKPWPKVVDLESKQAAGKQSIEEKYDHSEKIFDLKRSVVDAFSEGKTSYHLNAPFVEKVLSIKYPYTNPPQTDRESTKAVMIFVTEEMLRQRYENKYQYHYGYYYGSRPEDKKQCLSPTGEGPPRLDLESYRPR